MRNRVDPGVAIAMEEVRAARKAWNEDRSPENEARVNNAREGVIRAFRESPDYRTPSLRIYPSN